MNLWSGSINSLPLGIVSVYERTQWPSMSEHDNYLGGQLLVCRCKWTLELFLRYQPYEWELLDSLRFISRFVSNFGVWRTKIIHTSQDTRAPSLCHFVHCMQNPILVSRGPAPFSQHQESRPRDRSSEIPVLIGFANAIEWDQNQSDLSDLSD